MFLIIIHIKSVLDNFGFLIHKINGNNIKTHVFRFDFFAFEINKRCGQQLLLLPVRYSLYGKSEILTASGFDLYKAKHPFSILCNYINLALPASIILLKDFILVLFKKLSSQILPFFTR